ncbi:hypothetical protein BJ322DRAFT_1085391 [Thelephora terrestris]|uniref:Uncharacterized protein n=1 Tax=Thelephora terrestris TaxID=56493 RepID=A0A9P6L2W6_9AGAM|nr:hypothetical protein BJ322DRAFT_1085391 [Thelephora terrestris]
MYNNAPVLDKLGERLNRTSHHGATPRKKVRSSPCLPQRLPNTRVLERDAEEEIPRLALRRLRHSPSPPPESVASEEAPSPSESTAPSSPTTPHSPTFGKNLLSRLYGGSKLAPMGLRSWEGSEPQSWEVFRAIERKDLMFLMEVRDRAFHVLLKKSGDATPLVHSMRIGKSHSDVTIVLVGALSRWVNNLPDEEVNLPRTKTLLRALRTNLKLAIDYGLQSQQNDLIASFMQTLIMSEGEKWVQDQTVAIAIALRSGTEGKPVTSAEMSIRKFATRELGRANYISALEDYVANATADLIMMAAWHCALDVLPDAGSIPTWYFARDDRVHKVFTQELDKHATVISQKAGRRLRWQIRVLRTVMEGRSTSNKQKVDLLRAEFDEGPGV